MYAPLARLGGVHSIGAGPRPLRGGVILAPAEAVVTRFPTDSCGLVRSGIGYSSGIYGNGRANGAHPGL